MVYKNDNASVCQWFYCPYVPFHVSYQRVQCEETETYTEYGIPVLYKTGIPIIQRGTRSRTGSKHTCSEEEGASTKSAESVWVLHSCGALCCFNILLCKFFILFFSGLHMISEWYRFCLWKLCWALFWLVWLLSSGCTIICVFCVGVWLLHCYALEWCSHLYSSFIPSVLCVCYVERQSCSRQTYCSQLP